MTDATTGRLSAADALRPKSRFQDELLLSPAVPTSVGISPPHHITGDMLRRRASHPGPLARPSLTHLILKAALRLSSAIGVIIAGFLSCAPSIETSQPNLKWRDIDSDARIFVSWLDSLDENGCQRIVEDHRSSDDSTIAFIQINCADAYDALIEIVVDLQKKGVIEVRDLDGP